MRERIGPITLTRREWYLIAAFCGILLGHLIVNGHLRAEEFSPEFFAQRSLVVASLDNQLTIGDERLFMIWMEVTLGGFENECGPTLNAADAYLIRAGNFLYVAELSLSSAERYYNAGDLSLCQLEYGWHIDYMNATVRDIASANNLMNEIELWLNAP